MFLPPGLGAPGMRSSRNYPRSRSRNSSVGRYSAGETSRWEPWNLEIFSKRSSTTHREPHLIRLPSDALLGRRSSKLVSSSWCSTWRYLFFLLKGCQGMAGSSANIKESHYRLLASQLFQSVCWDWAEWLLLLIWKYRNKRMRAGWAQQWRHWLELKCSNILLSRLPT